VPSQQQPIADAAEPELLLREQHQDRQAGHGSQVQQPHHDSQGTQQPMGEQPAQPLEDLNPQASPRRAGGTPGAEAPLDGRDQRGAGRKRDGIDQERDGGAQREQQAAGRWADEVLAHGPSTIELAVRALQAVAGAGDQRWDERLGGVVEQRLAGPEKEPNGGQQWDGRPACQHRHAKDPDHDDAAGVNTPHHPTPIPSVDQRAADQPEQ
jgi:hypothetical protein